MKRILILIVGLFALLSLPTFSSPMEDGVFIDSCEVEIAQRMVNDSMFYPVCKRKYT